MELSHFNSYRSKGYRSWNGKLNSKYIHSPHVLCIKISLFKILLEKDLQGIVSFQFLSIEGISIVESKIELEIYPSTTRPLHQILIIENSTRKRFIGNCLVSILIDRRYRIVELKIELEIYPSITHPLHQNFIVQNSNGY